jgi:uncharacterized membrane protein YbaN (DUF454 family)
MEKLREVAGLVLLTAGVIGCVLPVIPGVPFLLGAALILGPRHPKIKPWLARIRLWRRLARKTWNLKNF